MTMKPDWNMKPDFHILFLPRSGSHMLVNALNSHPELDVTHSDQGHHGKGNLKGHAQCVVNDDVKKAIILIRNSKDRTNSFFTNLAEKTGSNHSRVPVEVERRYPDKAANRYKNQEIKNKRFFESVSKIKDALLISYEDLTENKSITEFPEEYSFKICDFLGIERRILVTELVKPTVIGNEKVS